MGVGCWFVRLRTRIRTWFWICMAGRRLLQRCAAGLSPGLKTEVLTYTSVRSFLMHNRCALPEEREVKVKSPRPGVTRKRSLGNLTDAVKGANLRIARLH